MKPRWRLQFLAVILVVQSACVISGDDNPDAAGAPDAYRPIAFAADYAATGTWDLSGPINANRTLGDVVADLIIDQIIALAGVPSLVQDQARDFLNDRFAASIAAAVDASAPAEQLSSSPLMQALAALLVQVDVASDITLSQVGQSGVSGNETISTFTFDDNGQSYVLAAGVLSPQITLAATWAGTTSGTTLGINPHVFQLRYGDLVLWVAENVLANGTLADIQSAAAAAIGCVTIVELVTGGKTVYDFSIVGVGYTVTANDLQSVCDNIVTDIGGRVLGLFSRDTPIEVGGEVRLVDQDNNLVAEGLANSTGYGGVVDIGPRPLAPRVDISFRATRQ